MTIIQYGNMIRFVLSYLASWNIRRICTMTDNKNLRVAKRANNLILKRRSAAQKLATSPTTTVTLRIPVELNEWLNEYQHLSYPNRISKGRLVIEGLILAYLRRGRVNEKILDYAEVLEP